VGNCLAVSAPLVPAGRTQPSSEALHDGSDPSRPVAFCWWLFDLLGALPGDELVDLFPGSGGIGRAWRLYTPAGESRRSMGEQTAGAACG
jgi:hypothetical protein